MHALPRHLQKYIVEQNYERYTPVDQACWRFILRQLKAFLSVHGHPSYLEGLAKTGIEIERIPKISEISNKLEKFGWRALPVSGFIPPAAFMELQSLSVLPVASDMRTLDHLLYTPAPDIVHEAAGHAPILIDPEYADYLKQYAQVAKKAIISKEDLNLYEAIRHLSDIKENPQSTPTDIEKAQKQLDETSKKMTHVSEAGELSRMNWWTAEYGLIGDLKNPKIFGAGLLSSVGESRWCLSEKVKKIPLTKDCVKTTYDITEPQPQLFVTPDFKTLIQVLKEFAQTMAFKAGGLKSVQKAIQAQSVNTVELNSGIQISGQCLEALTESDGQSISYLRFTGPCQLSYDDQELPGHGQSYHAQGFGTALGSFTSNAELKVGNKLTLTFKSGITVEGELQNSLEKKGQTVLLSFKNCTVKNKTQTLFEPAWGIYDMALGHSVTSVFGGPADRESYGALEDFIAARVPSPKYSNLEKQKHQLYQEIRSLRENKTATTELENELKRILQKQQEKFAQDWLLLLETYELALNRLPESSLKKEVHTKLLDYIKKNPATQSVIEDGLSLAQQI